MFDYSSQNNNHDRKSQCDICHRMISNLKSFVGRLFSRQSMGTVQVHIDTFNELRRAVTSLQMIAVGVGAIIGQ